MIIIYAQSEARKTLKSANGTRRALAIYTIT
jgi:hypothetical protein